MKENFGWSMTLFGTAVGAGILFLPISAGLAGIIVLVLVTLVGIPTIYFAHKNIGMMMTEAEGNVDYTGAVNEFLGQKTGFWINVVFFMTLFLLLIVYSSGLNDDIGQFMVDTGLTRSNLSHTIFLSLIILVILLFVIRVGENIMLRFMGFITFLLVAMLLAVSTYLIPQWNLSVIGQIYSPSSEGDHFLLLLPIFVLSFSYYPAMSSMIIAFKKMGLPKEKVLTRSNKIVGMSMILLIFFILFFVLSCILSLSPEQLEKALKENLSVLTVLAEKSVGSPLEYAGPVISQLALITSFVGTFLGARESARELMKAMREYSLKSKRGLFRFLAFDDLLLLSFLLVLWVVTILHLPILDILGELVAPPIAFFLCILPIWITFRVKRLKKYRSAALVFTLFIGCLMLFSYVLGKII
ncbi:MAG: aromatic amino acid transport family protein [Bacteroidales bacterium]|jgi:amino acid permease|nr:aromatic amino acid transport family protein [Bacteroidales bacterium]